MDNNELIRKITEEVKKQLGGSQTSRPSCESPQLNLVRKQIGILEHAISELKALEQSLSAGHSPAALEATSKPEMLLSSGACSFCDPGNCTGCGYCIVNNKNSVSKLMEAGAIRIGSGAGIPSAPGDLASYIDHTLLKPDATADQVIALCEEAKKYQFASVCINPTWVSLAAKILAGTKVRVCTVIGFPLGATASSVKAYETRRAATDGAGEIDMVINIGALKSKNFKLVEEDIRRVVESAGDRIVKVILETALLTDEEKIIGCTLSKAAGAHFVKTSTGFGPGGATVKDVALMREAVGEDMGVKASGGVRDTKTAMEMVKAGATRIGASASVAIVSGQAAGSGKY